MTPAAPRSPRGHHCHRGADRALYYRGENGDLVELSPRAARALIDEHGSVRRAAAAIGLPKSTVFDVARDRGKRPSWIPTRGRR